VSEPIQDTMTATESAFAQMWCDLLGRTDIGAGDDFFAAGGTSMTAIKLLQRVEKRFGPNALSPETLYADATLAGLAAAVDEAAGRR